MAKHQYSYLALGDSYTIGESVPLHESFPYQTIQLLRKANIHFHAAEMVAKTGWTSFELAEHMLHTKLNEQYDFVIDAVGRSSFFKCKRLLKKNGIYTSSGGAENLILILITPLLGGKKVVFKPAKSIKAALNFIKELIEKGSFSPVIDRTYPLDKIAEAFTYVATGQKIGNVIITMDA